MHIRSNLCLRTWQMKPLREVVNLGFSWRYWGAVKERSRAKGDRCGPVDIIRRVFPDATEDAAIRVASCESHLYTYAHNPSGASGLFQLMPFWWSGKFDPFDPWANTRAAYSISHGGTNWSAWVCSPY